MILAYVSYLLFIFYEYFVMQRGEKYHIQLDLIWLG